MVFLYYDCLCSLSCAYHAINKEISLDQQHNLKFLSTDDGTYVKSDYESKNKSNSEINHHYSSDDTFIDINVKKSKPSKFDITHKMSSSSNNENSNYCIDKNGFICFIKKFLPFIVGESPTNSYLAIIFPLITLMFMNYLLNNVPYFIHYQRLREIIYTLQVYNLWQEAKQAKAKQNRNDLNIRRAEVGLPPLTDIYEDRYYF